MIRLAAIFGVFFSLSLVEAAEIRTTHEKLEDAIASIIKDGDQTIVTLASGKKLALEDVKEVRFSEKAPARLHDARVFLLSGDELAGTIGDAVKDGESFTLSSVSLGNVDVTLDSVAAIFFDVSAEREERLARKCLAWLRESRGERPRLDHFRIRTGDGRSGTVQSFSKDGLVFKDGDGTIWPRFALRQLESLVLGGDAPKPRANELSVRLHLVDGSIVSGRVAKLENGKLSLEGLGFAPELAVDLGQVLSLEVRNGAFTYLSDLTPALVDEHFPQGFARPDLFDWKRDREVESAGPLRLAGRTYAKGLGVHSYSALTFDLRGAYREMRAVVGLDDSTRYEGHPGVGSVTFRVLVDGKVAKEVQKERGEAPTELSVPTEGAKELTLVCDYGNFLHVLGRADWADACLVK